VNLPLLECSARLLALAWAGLWLYFFIVESVATHSSLSAAAPWIGLGLLLFLAAWVPWRWEIFGGLLLIALGLAGGAAYALNPPAGLPIATRVVTLLAYSVPSLTAGVLFLLHHHAHAAHTRHKAA